MILIVGLGNLGEKYKNNRHNVGFMFCDYVANRIMNYELRITNEAVKFKHDKYLLSEIYELPTTHDKLVLAKPQTFMNKSGEAVSKLISNFQLPISNVIVIHDDLDIALGEFKIQKGTGPQLHNGITSIENHLKTKDFWRVRIGVDNRGEARIDGETYVLSDFMKSEREELESLFPEIQKKLEEVVASSK